MCCAFAFLLFTEIKSALRRRALPFKELHLSVHTCFLPYGQRSKRGKSHAILLAPSWALLWRGGQDSEGSEKCSRTSVCDSLHPESLKDTENLDPFPRLIRFLLVKTLWVFFFFFFLVNSCFSCFLTRYTKELWNDYKSNTCSTSSAVK